MQDFGAYALDVFHDLIIPETQRQEFACFKMPIANPISRRFGMLASVEFYYQTHFETHEIHDEVHWHLTFELQSFKLLVPKRLPKFVFGWRCIPAHSASEIFMA
jgi:hypothetical protein